MFHQTVITFQKTRQWPLINIQASVYVITCAKQERDISFIKSSGSCFTFTTCGLKNRHGGMRYRQSPAAIRHRADHSPSKTKTRWRWTCTFKICFGNKMLGQVSTCRAQSPCICPHGDFLKFKNFEQKCQDLHLNQYTTQLKKIVQKWVIFVLNTGFWGLMSFKFTGLLKNTVVIRSVDIYYDMFSYNYRKQTILWDILVLKW